MHGMIPVPNLLLDPQTPQRLLLVIKDAGLQLVLIAQVADGDLVDVVLAQ